jgi:enamine deaminase RidA (YjgF/YER057c/UK114 family)
VAVEALLSTEGGPGRIPVARGVRAGPWTFVSGITGHVMPDNPRPLSGLPRWSSEAASMYTGALAVLRAGGTDYAGAVRTDQYFPDWRAVSFHHQARREACGNAIAPSTSVLMPGLPGGAGMAMNVLGTRSKVSLLFPEGLDVPAQSSFAPVATANGFVFVAGFMAAHGEGDLGGIAPEAKVPEGHLWKGNRIQLEVDYIIRKKLIPALAGAGCTLADVVKAQVYLADIEDVPAVNQVWRRHFGDFIPATSFIPTSRPGFAIVDACCEINLIAYPGTKKSIAVEGIVPACDGHPLAVLAGDLLLFSGMVAADTKGVVEPQMEYLVDAVARTCSAAGTSLDNVVRIQQFHADLRDVEPTCTVWQRHLPGVALPLAAVQVVAPLVVPGCTVQVDCWVYAG